MARWRNRPRGGLAWTIVLALILLVLVAARSSAAPITEGEAARYADALSGQATRAASGSPAHVGSESEADAATRQAGADTWLDDADAPVDAATRDLLDELGAADADTLDLDALEASVGLSGVTLRDPAELRDVMLRQRPPSRWGRLELSVAWRRAWRGPAAGATTAAALVDDALIVFATWRR